MKLLLNYMPFLLCAGAMVACMRMMGGGSRDETDRTELAELREEVARLRAQTPATSGIEPATGSDLEDGFARGEIDAEELERRRATLGGSR